MIPQETLDLIRVRLDVWKVKDETMLACLEGMAGGHDTVTESFEWPQSLAERVLEVSEETGAPMDGLLGILVSEMVARMAWAFEEGEGYE